MTEDEIIERVRNLKRGRSRGTDAPHKPMLLLLALRLHQDGVTDIPYATVHERLGSLLREFNPSGTRPSPQFPFWFLRSDGALWAVDIPPWPRPVPSKPDWPDPREFNECGATGRLGPDVQAALRANPLFLHRMVGAILRHHIAEPLHAPLLEALEIGATPAGTAAAGMAEDEIIGRVRDLKKGRSRGANALHKPLLLLLALRLHQEGVTNIPYATVHERLGALLRKFNPSGAKPSPYFPFWFLRSDDVLWAVDIPPWPRRVPSKPDWPDPREFTECGATGRLGPDVQVALRANPSFLHRMVDAILRHHIPEELRAPLLGEMGLGAAPEEEDARRDLSPVGFRHEVLLAYNSQCAICDFTVAMRDTFIALEAAHIRWRSWDGPDIVTNGIALCANHHRMFDRGVFTIEGPDRGYAVRVSKSAQFPGGIDQARRLVRDMDFSPPLRAENNPDPLFLEWHRDNVFERRPRHREHGAP